MFVVRFFDVEANFSVNMIGSDVEAKLTVSANVACGAALPDLYV